MAQSNPELKGKKAELLECEEFFFIKSFKTRNQFDEYTSKFIVG